MLNFKFIILPLSGLILFISIYITIIIQLKDFEQEVKNYDLYSSVYCNSPNIVDNINQINQTNNYKATYERRCKFRNLCYKVNSQEFIFILNKDKSLLINLPIDRFKPSLQYLGSIEHNNFYFNYVDIDYLDYKQLFADKKLVLIKDLTLIYSRFKPDNLMHLIHDDLLPIYNTLKSIFFNYDKKPKRLNFFIFDDYNHVGSDYYSKLFYSILFKNVNIFYKNDFKANDQLICFENVEIGLDKLTSFYDYGFRYYQKPINKTENEKQLIQLYTNEIKNLIIKDGLESFLDLNFGKEKDPFKCDQENYIVLLSRTRSRLILNEDQVMNQLKEKFNDLKVIKIDLENGLESLDSLIRILSCTKLIIGMHGAGLILSIFLPKNSNLIEFFPYKINSSYYRPYKQLANVYELNYYDWSNTNNSNNFYNFEYLKEEIKDKIYEDQDVELSLCCDESYFLFRIYQDTIIDKGELDQLLNRISIEKDEFSKKIEEDELTQQQILKIAPSNLKLECIRKDKIINLKWTRPWNIIKNINNLEYEIIINIPGDNISNMYNLKDNNLVIDLNNLKDVNSKLYIWIRAKLDNLKGPFNDKQFEC